MKVTVLYFAQAREHAGCASEPLELPEGSRAGDARAAIVRAHPGLAPLSRQMALAVDGRIASDANPLVSGAELAVLPPVSGG